MSESAMDAQAPSVSSTSPPVGATGVELRGGAVLTFNEALDLLKVTAQTTTPLATLVPSPVLTVTADVQDPAGNVDTFAAIRFTTGS